MYFCVIKWSCNYEDKGGKSWLKNNPFGYGVDKGWLALIVNLIESEIPRETSPQCHSWVIILVNRSGSTHPQGGWWHSTGIKDGKIA